MNLIRWKDRTPFSLIPFESSQIEGWFDRALDSFMNTFSGGVDAYPRVNLWQNDERVYAECEVPGLRMEDLEILVDGRELTIRGKKLQTEHEGAMYLRRERSTGEFTRTFTLQVPVQVDKIDARLVDGVLTIQMPKSPEVRPRRIEVK